MINDTREPSNDYMEEPVTDRNDIPRATGRTEKGMTFMEWNSRPDRAPSPPLIYEPQPRPPATLEDELANWHRVLAGFQSAEEEAADFEEKVAVVRRDREIAGKRLTEAKDALVDQVGTSGEAAALERVRLARDEAQRTSDLAEAYEGRPAPPRKPDRDPVIQAFRRAFRAISVAELASVGPEIHAALDRAYAAAQLGGGKEWQDFLLTVFPRPQTTRHETLRDSLQAKHGMTPWL